MKTNIYKPLNRIIVMGLRKHIRLKIKRTYVPLDDERFNNLMSKIELVKQGELILPPLFFKKKKVVGK